MHSQTAEYAMRAMACLAQYRELVATPTLADQTGVPANYLAKVLQMLAGAGLIAGRRGVGGGYRLARPADDITLLQVIDAVDPLPRNRTVPQTNGQSHGTLAALSAKLEEAAQSVVRVYQHAALSDLVRGETVNRQGSTAAVSSQVRAVPARTANGTVQHAPNGFAAANGGRIAAMNGNGHYGHGTNGHSTSGNSAR